MTPNTPSNLHPAMISEVMRQLPQADRAMVLAYIDMQVLSLSSERSRYAFLASHMDTLCKNQVILAKAVEKLIQEIEVAMAATDRAGLQQASQDAHALLNRLREKP